MRTFAVFAKFWQKGKVKTRLAKSIGDSHAAAIYLHFLRLTLKINPDSIDQKIIGYTPPEKKEAFRVLAPDWQLVSQSDTDLGNRMSNFMGQVFRSTGESSEDHRLVLIGSDTPLLPPRIINQAFEKLEAHDVVLGPSLDGGYYLVGARNQTPDIFQGIDWSTGSVLQQSIEQLRKKGYRYALLEEFSDIDELDELVQFTHSLSEQNALTKDQRQVAETVQQAFETAKIDFDFSWLDSPGGSR